MRKAVPQGALSIRRVVDARYIGQGHELTLPLPDNDLEPGYAARLRTQFEQLYKAVYGVTMPGQDVELVTWSVTVSSAPEPPMRRGSVSKRTTLAPPAKRTVYEPALGRVTDFAVYQRDDLAPGDELAGPALIEEAQTTTVVPASFTAYIESGGMIVMERKK